MSGILLFSTHTIKTYWAAVELICKGQFTSCQVFKYTDNNILSVSPQRLCCSLLFTFKVTEKRSLTLPSPPSQLACYGEKWECQIVGFWNFTVGKVFVCVWANKQEAAWLIKCVELLLPLCIWQLRDNFRCITTFSWMGEVADPDLDVASENKTVCNHIQSEQPNKKRVFPDVLKYV